MPDFPSVSDHRVRFLRSQSQEGWTVRLFSAPLNEGIDPHVILNQAEIRVVKIRLSQTVHFGVSLFPSVENLFFVILAWSAVRR